MGKDSHLARSLLEKLHPDRIRFDISLCDSEVHHVPKSRQIPVDSRRTALLKPCDLESLDRRHVYIRDLSSKKFEKRFRTHPIPLMSRGFILGLRPRQELLNELGEVWGFLTRLAHDYLSLFPGLHSHRLSLIREACGSPILNAVVNELKPVNGSSLVDLAYRSGSVSLSSNVEDGFSSTSIERVFPWTSPLFAIHLEASTSLP